MCFVIYCLFASRTIWKPFYRRLRFRVVLTVRKMGRLLGTPEADRSSSKLHKSHKMDQVTWKKKPQVEKQK